MPGSNIKLLLINQALFEEESENSSFNSYIEGRDKRLGVIVCGIAYNYLFENFQSDGFPHPLLKIGQYPLPYQLIRKIYQECESILVLEEGYPMLEELLRGILDNGKKILGRMDGTVPRDGELNPNLVARALGLNEDYGFPIPPVVKSRPPSLCKGCPHIYSYNALNEALSFYSKGRVFSDIGCYTLGALEPYSGHKHLC